MRLNERQASARLLVAGNQQTPAVSGRRDHGATLDDGADRSRPGTHPETWRRPSLRCAFSSSPSGSHGAPVCWPVDSARTRASSLSMTAGAPAARANFGPSACAQAGPASAVRVPQGDRPPPGAARRPGAPRECELPRRRDRPRSGRASSRSSRTASEAPQRQLVADRLGELEHLRQFRQQASRPAHARIRASSRPGLQAAPAVRPQAFGHGRRPAARQAHQAS